MQTEISAFDQQHGEESPDVSIALLIRNGMPELAGLLESLRGQRGCGVVEIVAVDSGSTDGSLEALRRAGARVTEIDPATFRFGPTRQMVFGLTRGRVIVTLSQDAMPGGPDWLAGMTGPILDGSMDIVQSIEKVPEDQRAKLNLYNYTWPYERSPMPYRMISCAGMAISRAAWERTGFGDVMMSEDKFLSVAAHDLGLRMDFCTAVPLLHGHNYTAKSLIKRSFNEGVGARPSKGIYSLRLMLRDIFRPGQYRQAAGAVLKHRTLNVFEASLFPLRPLFLYIGYRFGNRYWR